MNRRLIKLLASCALVSGAAVSTTGCDWLEETFQRIKCTNDRGSRERGDTTEPASCKNVAGVEAVGVHECWAFPFNEPGLCTNP